jgi:hypothetical protein
VRSAGQFDLVRFGVVRDCQFWKFIEYSFEPTNIQNIGTFAAYRNKTYIDPTNTFVGNTGNAPVVSLFGNNTWKLSGNAWKVMQIYTDNITWDDRDSQSAAYSKDYDLSFVAGTTITGNNDGFMSLDVQDSAIIDRNSWYAPLLVGGVPTGQANPEIFNLSAGAVANKKLSDFQNAGVATGGRPAYPDFFGPHDVGLLTAPNWADPGNGDFDPL